MRETGYFERVSPSAVGIDPVLLEEATDSLLREGSGLHALLVLRHGKVAAETYMHPYRADARHSLFSVTKSFTAIGASFAAAEGRLSLEDKVIFFFPEKIPSDVCENMKKMTIRHLLTMTSGFDAAPHDFKRHRRDDVINDFPYSYDHFIFQNEIDWVKDFLRSYVAYSPGAKFLYSNACPYMLSAIVEKVSGQTLFEYLKERLFDPLGIEDLCWQKCPAGHTVGGWGLSLRPEDVAKFAQFMLQKGRWEGKQLIGPAYIEEAAKSWVSTGNSAVKWERGFGYQIWIVGDEGAYAGIGAFGQMYLVFPKQDAVVVILGGSRTYMKAIDTILDKLLPAMRTDGAFLPHAAPARRQPRELPPPEGLSSWDVPRSVRYSGVEYVFSQNDLGITSVQFEFGAEDFLTLGIDGNKTRMKIGYGAWEYGYTGAAEGEDTDVHTQIFFHAAALSGAWKGDTYCLYMVFYQTCYINRMEIHFTDHGVCIRHSRNVGFIQNTDTQVVGMREESAK